MKLRNLTYWFMALPLLLGAGCRDDYFDMDYGDTGTGDAVISATVDFTPLAGALGDTRAAGNAIRDIENLTVVIYDRFDKFVRMDRITAGEHGLTIDKNGNTAMPDDAWKPDDAEAPDKSEASTARARFTLQKLPRGSYKMYAVANMEIDEETAKDIKELKGLICEWDTRNVAANNQMFGYFTMSDSETSAGFDAPTVIVNKADMQIHAWIKRLASKMTIAFDPSGLHNGVQVFIHEVSIHDIPRHCRLGMNNDKTFVKEDSDIIVNPGDEDPKQILYFGTGGITPDSTDPTPGSTDANADANSEKWLRLIRSTGIVGTHTENDQALYFYENMQGNYNGQSEYDKKQDPDAVGTPSNKPGDPDYKDKVALGTYVEVKGYYKANVVSSGYVSEGPITYRFMLGKDVRFDYNAERNMHYKLTLQFKGYANQVDWHIDYKEQPPALFVPETFYMSYLYNTKSMLPVRAVGDLRSLKAEIVENNWYPCIYDENTRVKSIPVSTGSESSDPENRFLWNRDAYTMFDNGNTQKKTDYACMGWLSLSAPDDSADPPANILENYSHQDKETGINALRSYYEGTGYGNGKSQKLREYDVKTEGMKDPSKMKTAGFNTYYVTKSPDGMEKATMVRIPMITRNKSMVSGTGFSGNNPYVQFQRYAKVKITAVFNYGGTTKTIEKYVDVVQVRRVVNPKAVWRSYDDNTMFNVTLYRLPDVGSDFMEFLSEGEWKAYVVNKENEHFVKLNGTRMVNDTVFGDMGTPIKFDLLFSGVSQGSAEGAVVNVEYHGFTCTHKIFVRQGYNYAMELPSGSGTRWSSFNLFSADGATGVQASTRGASNPLPARVTQNPLAIGTLFKRGNYQEGILIRNNNNYGPLVLVNNKNLEVSGANGNGGQYAQFTKIEARSRGTSATNNVNGNWEWAWFKAEVNGRNRLYRVPKYEEFKALDQCGFGFGVLYADGATKPQTSRANAYGFQDDNNNTTRSEMGVRGCVVYDKSTGAQIFFPLGKNGMGRRIALLSGGNQGYLRYGDVGEPLKVQYDKDGNPNANIYRPIPYDLPAAPGAIYWTSKINWTGHYENGSYYPCAGWDINYFNFDFNPYTANCLGTGNNTSNNASDALPIKLIFVKDL